MAHLMFGEETRIRRTAVAERGVHIGWRLEEPATLR